MDAIGSNAGVAIYNVTCVRWTLWIIHIFTSREAEEYVHYMVKCIWTSKLRWLRKGRFESSSTIEQNWKTTIFVWTKRWAVFVSRMSWDICITPECTAVSNVIKSFAQLIRYPNTKGQKFTELQHAEAAKNRFVHKILCLNTGGTSTAVTTDKDDGEGNPC